MEAKFLLLLRLEVIYKFINCLENFSANISSHGSLWKGTKRDWLKIPASSQSGKMLIEICKSSKVNKGKSLNKLFEEHFMNVINPSEFGS